MPQFDLLLYGANGFTGRLIAGLAQEYGLKPVLAGRRGPVIKKLADELQLPFLHFELDDSKALQDALQQTQLVIHAAGPFDQTARQMIMGCLQTGTHYLDINGDLSVFEMVQQFDEAAKKAGIMLMSGTGFDVVPTDCLSLYLKNMLPDASQLELAFTTYGGGISRGTALTMIQNLGRGGASRKAGKIQREPLGKKGKWVDFGKSQLFVMSIPWGDVFTAYYTTGIRNIRVYTAVPQKLFFLMKGQGIFNWLLRTSFVKNIFAARNAKRAAGPSKEKRETAKSVIWGRVGNQRGEVAIARQSGPEGYTLTAHCSLLIASKVLGGEFKSGYQTPAGMYGADLILNVPGVERTIVLEPSLPI